MTLPRRVLHRLPRHQQAYGLSHQFDLQASISQLLRTLPHLQCAFQLSNVHFQKRPLAANVSPPKPVPLHPVLPNDAQPHLLWRPQRHDQFRQKL